MPPLVWEHVDTLAYRRETGDDGVLCEHEWGVVQMSKANDSNRGTLEWTTGGDPAAKVLGQKVEQGQFCQHCHAWRGSLGLEPSPELFVSHLVEVMRDVWRVLRDDGTLWLNLGSSYASAPQRDNHADPKAPRRTPGDRCRTNAFKPKDLIPIPWMVALALQADGWYLRSDIIWAKGLSFCPTYSGSCMPESVRDRPTKGHEYMFLLTKKPRYYYDQEAVREASADPARTHYAHGAKLDDSRNDGDRMDFGGGNGRNLRSVWTINPGSFPEAHFATFPPALVDPCIKASTSERGVCPECGAPWVRVTERGVLVPDSAHVGSTMGSKYTEDDQTGWTNDNFKPGHHYENNTTGWQPTCTCEAGDPVPATILDPFGGAGTVGLVADRLGRDARLIDLNEEYVQMAYDRLVGDAPLFAAVTLERPEHVEGVGELVGVGAL